MSDTGPHRDFRSGPKAIDGTPETQLEYEYDDSGTRVSQTIDGTKTLFVVDKQNPSGYSQVLE